jgi:hypothetical protein
MSKPKRGWSAEELKRAEAIFNRNKALVQAGESSSPPRVTTTIATEATKQRQRQIRAAAAKHRRA